MRSMSQAPFIRNIFAFEDEEESWKAVLSQFPNRVPRFESKEEAIEFTQQHCLRGSNPDYPTLQHSITTLIDWKQIETILLPKVYEYEERWPETDFTYTEGQEGVDELQKGIFEYAKSRLDLSIHKNMCSVSRMNTLKYLFFHMKCGIYVMIRNNQVAVFCPFVNKDYQNNWNGKLRIGSSDGTLESYVEEKKEEFKKYPMHYLPLEQWWANGNIICNDYGASDDQNQYWGDHFLFQLKDMFAELCRTREVPNCEFFVNKRDYPQLKYNTSLLSPVEPYGFIYDKDDNDPDQDIGLTRQRYKSYAPILSFYSSRRFADLPLPPTEDWEGATGQVFPASFKYSIGKDGQLEVAAPRDLFTKKNLDKFHVEWGQKVPTAFFRGTATGGGVTTKTNQRLHIAQVSHDWSLSKDYITSSGHPYLDAKITGWNLRDKKLSSSPMTYLTPSLFPFPGDKKTNFVEIYKQSTFKYVVYIEGHCAACRYAFMMLLGSVILKVESTVVAREMWYFPLLSPYEDHLPVKADLSDLREKLEWCHAHDQECEQIARRAKEKYEKYLSREGILTYLSYLCNEVAVRWRDLPLWARETRKEVDWREVMGRQGAEGGHIEGCVKNSSGDWVFCSYCQELLERQRLSLLHPPSSAPGSAPAQQSERKKAQRSNLKARMLERARANPGNVALDHRGEAEAVAGSGEGGPVVGQKREREEES